MHEQVILVDESLGKMSRCTLPVDRGDLLYVTCRLAVKILHLTCGQRECVRCAENRAAATSGPPLASNGARSLRTIGHQISEKIALLS